MAVTGILGRKIGMTQVFDEKGDVHPITVLQAGPCVITQLKTATRDGYDAAQIGLVEFVKASRITEPQKGHLAKSDAPPVKFIKEVDIEAATDGGDGVKAGNHPGPDRTDHARRIERFTRSGHEDLGQRGAW